jgi:hypothetical protein
MSRRCPRLAVAGAILTIGVAFAAPASAAVRYDPETKTGFVDTADVRQAFGWTTATLVLRAGGVAFDHEFWTDDTYAVACGGRVHPVVHHRVSGRFELIHAVVRRDGPRPSTGYGITGFRLTGASSGISGTSLPPAVGRPCPAGPGWVPGSTVDKLRLVSSATGWSLVVRSGGDRRVLRRVTVKRVVRHQQVRWYGNSGMYRAHSPAVRPRSAMAQAYLAGLARRLFSFA